MIVEPLSTKRTNRDPTNGQRKRFDFSGTGRLSVDKETGVRVRENGGKEHSTSFPLLIRTKEESPSPIH